MKDAQMLIVRKGVNEIIEECAVAAEQGGPDAVRKLKVEESGDVPPKSHKYQLGWGNSETVARINE